MREVEAPWLRPEARGLQWASLFIVVLLAPLAEERFFRGTLFTTLEAEGRTRFAIIGTALAFAAAHPYGAPAATACGAGLTLGLLRAWTGDWRVCVLVHAFFNAGVWATLQQSV
jgi:membrane protease YdiL (CAAX protease family)